MAHLRIPRRPHGAAEMFATTLPVFPISGQTSENIHEGKNSCNGRLQNTLRKYAKDNRIGNYLHTIYACINLIIAAAHDRDRYYQPLVQAKISRATMDIAMQLMSRIPPACRWFSWYLATGVKRPRDVVDSIAAAVHTDARMQGCTIGPELWARTEVSRDLCLPSRARASGLLCLWAREADTSTWTAACYPMTLDQ